MIDLGALMSKITGKAARMPGDDALRAAGGEAGVTTGGDFAALVELAAQTRAAGDQSQLRLVVDNGGEPGGKALPFAGQPTMPDFTGTGDGRPLPAALPTDMLPADVQTSARKIGKKATPDDVAVRATETDVPPDSSIAARTEDRPETDKPRDSETPVDAQAGLADPAMLLTIPTAIVPAAVMPGATLPDLQPLPSVAVALSSDRPKPEGRGTRAAQSAPAMATALRDVEAAEADMPEQGVSTGGSGLRAGNAASVTPAMPGSPLRMIVESLPPVIQSELMAPAISSTTGPSTGQQLGDQVIDMGVSGQWIDRMAREITALAAGNGHSRFTLNPPHLGRLEVNLRQDQDVTSVSLVTQTDEAARRLSEGRNALQADARMAALNLGTITIERASPSHEPSRDQGQRHSGEQASQMQQQPNGQTPGQNHARAGNGQQGDWANRGVREEPTQQSDAPVRTSAQRAASSNVRFA